MQIVSICEHCGWTYDEYMSQPQWFILFLKAKLEIDSDKDKNQIKGLKNKNGT